MMAVTGRSVKPAGRADLTLYSRGSFMSRLKCPGSTPGNIMSDSVKCASCGHATEIFSDETWIRCPSCGSRVERAADKKKEASCYDWCRSARECMGAAAYNKYMTERSDKNESKKKDNKD